MTLREHARKLACEEVDALCRQRRRNGLPDPVEDHEWGAYSIRDNVFQKLKAAKDDDGKPLYGSISLYWFLATTLLRIVWEVIKYRREHVSNLGGA